MAYKTYIFLLCSVLCLTTLACKEKLEQELNHSPKEKIKQDSSEKTLRHFVAFKFNETSSDQDITMLNKAFNTLVDSIPTIVDFEWGINNSPENLHQDFTHCYLLSFTSEKDRDAYLPHPAHQAFVKMLEPHLEKVFVVDYWNNR